MAITVDRKNLARVQNSPERMERAKELIREMLTVGFIPASLPEQDIVDLRTIMFFYPEFETVQWNHDGVKWFIWGYDPKHPVSLHKNWREFQSGAIAFLTRI